MECKLINVKQAAEILSVPISWIYQETAKEGGAIPHYRMGKHIRFNPDEIKEYFKIKESSGEK